MTAKIKSHPKFNTKNSHAPRPRNISDKAFHKVYWPFIPVLVSVCLLLALAVQTVPLHHLSGKVLSYQTSKNSEEILKFTNIQRQKDGEPALRMNYELVAAAQAKADDMAKRDYWSHYTPDGTAPWSFVSATGYVYESMGENLAAGFNDDSSVVNAWMASPHHRENMLNKIYTEAGFAYANIADYKAVGGGPMTIVVAYYAKPAYSGVAAQTSQPTTPITTASTTTRMASASGLGNLASWAPVILGLGGFAAIVMFFEKHRRYFLTAAVQGERYVMRHPATDMGLLVIIALIFLLAQTAGYIQ